MRSTRIAAALAAVAVISLAAPAQANTTFDATLSRSTNLAAGGDTIAVTVTNLPNGSGLYVRQCVAATTAGARAGNCNGQGIWVTTTVPAGTPGTVAPGGIISLPVVASYVTSTGTVDCTKTQCGVFVRRDHFGPTDLSLDRFIPITFVGDAIARPADAITVKVGGASLTAGKPFSLAYRTPVTLDVTTTSGLPATITSLAPACVVNGSVLTAVNAKGECAVIVRTAGNGSFAAAQSVYPATLSPAVQTIAVPAPATAKVGKSVVIATGATSSLGQPVKFRTLTAGCQVSTVKGQTTLYSSRARTCTVEATAAARAGLWSAAATRVSVKFVQ